ncbi:MAG: ribonucleotide reductase [Hyphomicrobium sp.]|nr:MAG: ribonucleotide reductase [Hyphomicrobium sp.]PPD01402.1 MAG: ribonucleotide reductase [Hyphomicrobium sp.]
MSDRADKLAALATALIDSRNGYFEALEDAEGRGLTTLFKEMVALRTEAIVELEPFVVAAGGKVNEDGSFMSTVHRTVISIRAMLTELDEKILPSLISGEERILGYYDDALKVSSTDYPEYAALQRQRGTLVAKITQMQSALDAAA